MRPRTWTAHALRFRDRAAARWSLTSWACGPSVRVNISRPYSSGRGCRPLRSIVNGELTVSSLTCRLAPSTPARIAVNSASGAHRAVANVLLTPAFPPQVTELNSVRRNFSPAWWARATAEAMSVENADVAYRLSTRATVGYPLDLGFFRHF